MKMNPWDVVEFVASREEAEQLIAALIAKFGSDTAYSRLAWEQQHSKQSIEEVARRTASNLLTSFKARRPGIEEV